MTELAQALSRGTGNKIDVEALEGHEYFLRRQSISSSFYRHKDLRLGLKPRIFLIGADKRKGRPPWKRTADGQISNYLLSRLAWLANPLPVTLPARSAPALH